MDERTKGYLDYDQPAVVLSDAEYGRLQAALADLARRTGACEASTPGRPAWDPYFLAIARTVATRATCPRRAVGALFVDGQNRIIGGGYNGAPAGSPHCLEVGCLLHHGGCVRAVHAEENALLHTADRAGLRGSTAYIHNGTPCYRCARGLVSVGIRRVVCAGRYPDEAAIALLEQMGIALEVRELCAQESP